MVGYNRTVKLIWLDSVAGLAAAGKSDAEIHANLSQMLGERLSPGSNAKRGSREKTITLLLKTWVRVPGQLRAFRDEGLTMFQTLPQEDRLALHWGMTFAVYPFCMTVAQVVGRSLRLQEQVVAAQVQRRVRELLGERETVARSTRYVLRAFVDWGALVDVGVRKGIQRAAPARPLSDPRVAGWLLEAVLRAGGGQPVLAKALVTSAALFPFALSQGVAAAALGSRRFEVSTLGPDQDMVDLRAVP